MGKTHFILTTNSNIYQPLGQKSQWINPKDSVKIIDHLTGKNVTLAPQLRIKLNDDFGKSLILNNQAGTNDTVFGEFLKGIYITSTSPTNEPFLYGVNLSRAESVAHHAGCPVLVVPILDA